MVKSPRGPFLQRDADIYGELRSFAHQLLGLPSGRWEVRIGLRGSKHVYLGLHSSEVEAARVYDRALVLLTGQTAATNFPVSNYKNQMDAYDQ